MHFWGDKDFDWKGLSDAIDFISINLEKYGRIGVDSKEKFGTARVYITWYYGTLHSLLYPSYHYIRFKDLFRTLDDKVFYNISKYTGFTYIFNKYQQKVYQLVYKKAIRRWPHLEEEITCCADYPELIDPKYNRSRG